MQTTRSKLREGLHGIDDRIPRGAELLPSAKSKIRGGSIKPQAVHSEVITRMLASDRVEDAILSAAGVILIDPKILSHTLCAEILEKALLQHRRPIARSRRSRLSEAIDVIAGRLAVDCQPVERDRLYALTAKAGFNGTADKHFLSKPKSNA